MCVIKKFSFYYLMMVIVLWIVNLLFFCFLEIGWKNFDIKLLIVGFVGLISLWLIVYSLCLCKCGKVFVFMVWWVIV